MQQAKWGLGYLVVDVCR